MNEREERHEVEELGEAVEELDEEVEELAAEVADLENPAPSVGPVTSVTIVSTPLTTTPKGPAS